YARTDDAALTNAEPPLRPLINVRKPVGGYHHRASQRRIERGHLQLGDVWSRYVAVCDTVGKVEWDNQNVQNDDTENIIQRLRRSHSFQHDPDDDHNRCDDQWPFEQPLHRLLSLK